MENTQLTNIIQLSNELLYQFDVINPTRKQLDKACSFILKVICDGHFVFDEKLTQKEALCLFWTAKGKKTTETAKILNISPGTVDTHKKRIMKKLNCRNMLQAVFEGMKLAYSCPHEPCCTSSNKKYPFLGTIFN